MLHPAAIVRQIHRVIALCGIDVQLQRPGESHCFRAFVQPDINRNRKFLEESYSAIGRPDTRRWLYRGPLEGPGSLLTEGDILDCGFAKLRVVSLADYLLGGLPAYRSGWLEPYHEGV